MCYAIAALSMSPGKFMTEGEKCKIRAFMNCKLIKGQIALKINAFKIIANNFLCDPIHHARNKRSRLLWKFSTWCKRSFIRMAVQNHIHSFTLKFVRFFSNVDYSKEILFKHFPDLTPCDLYLWGVHKKIVCMCLQY